MFSWYSPSHAVFGFFICFPVGSDLSVLGFSGRLLLLLLLLLLESFYFCLGPRLRLLLRLTPSASLLPSSSRSSGFVWRRPAARGLHVLTVWFRLDIS